VGGQVSNVSPPVWKLKVLLLEPTS